MNTGYNKYDVEYWAAKTATALTAIDLWRASGQTYEELLESLCTEAQGISRVRFYANKLGFDWIRNQGLVTGRLEFTRGPCTKCGKIYCERDLAKPDYQCARCLGGEPSPLVAERAESLERQRKQGWPNHRVYTPGVGNALHQARTAKSRGQDGQAKRNKHTIGRPIDVQTLSDSS